MKIILENLVQFFKGLQGHPQTLDEVLLVIFHVGFRERLPVHTFEWNP